MDQFNRDTYKQETLFQSFYRSCMGKIIIIAAILLFLFVAAVITRPDGEAVILGADENVQQCIQDNDSTKNDELDEFFANIVRTFTEADSTLTNQEAYRAFHKYNQIELYEHPAFSTVYVRNNLHPQGVRISIGIFNTIVSTVNYSDLMLDLGPARGKYNEHLAPVAVPEDDYEGENPNLKPYHYNGNPDD